MPYFFLKLEKMLQNLSSAAVVIGTLRVKKDFKKQTLSESYLTVWIQIRWREIGPNCLQKVISRRH